MKSIIFLIAGILAFAEASAAPTVSMHWSDCSSTAVDRAPGPISTIVVTGRGLSGTVRAHDVRVNFGWTGYGVLADAWRFDPAGCNAGGFSTPVTDLDGCRFLGANPTLISYFRSGESGGQALFAAAYDPPALDPATTYILARFVLDHTAGGTCACLEQAQCVHLVYATYLDGAGSEISFQLGQDFLTWNDPTNTQTFCGGTLDCDHCEPLPYPCSGPTAAVKRSWGRIKASYR